MNFKIKKPLNSKEIIAFGREIIRREKAEIEILENNITVSFAAAVSAICQTSGKVVLVGIGKNMPIGQKMVATLNSTGTRAQFLHAAEAIHGDLGLLDKKDVVIILSKSGNTKEIKNVFPYLKNLSAKSIAITADENSFLGQNADLVLCTPITKEAGPLNLAPTSSTTAQLVICDALAMAVKKLKQFTEVDFGQYHPGGSLGKNLLYTVEDLMEKNQKPNVQWDSTIKEVIQSLTSGRYGITAVLKNNEIIGVITDGDLRRMLEKHDSFEHLKAKDIATQNPKTISGNSLAKRALELINKYAIGQLLVLDKNGEYNGVIDFHRLTQEGIHAEK